MKQPFKIIFKDEYIVVLDKIAKILVQPSPKKEKYTLTSLLQQEIGKPVLPCHRLDRETTGLIIYARDGLSQMKIMSQFKTGKIKKKYTAFIKGNLKRNQGILEGYIIDSEGRKFGEKAKQAKTQYRVLDSYENFSVVELSPLTGRTNQLRIQLAQAGCPILGERKYAFGRDFKVKFRRLALHAFYLGFYHPVSNNFLEFKITLPQDMSEFLKKISQKTIL